MLQAIAEDPLNLDQVLIYCDRLEEQGHSHQWIRDCVVTCQYTDEATARWIILEVIVRSQLKSKWLDNSQGLTGTPSPPR